MLAETAELRKETVSQRCSEGDDSSEKKSDSDGSTECDQEKEVQLSEEPKSKVQLSEEPKKKVPSSEEPENEAQLSKESEKEEQLSKQTKASKVETWSRIRPSLCAIENMMTLRVKNIKDMKEKQNTINGDHLPSIKETGFLGGDSKEDIEQEACVKKTSDDNVSAFTEESTVDNEASPKLFFPWKEELEFLVRGGVPKDLRGEVKLTL